MKELEEQGITNYKLWDGVYHSHKQAKENISEAHKQIVEYAKMAEFGSVIIAEDDIRFFAPGAWKHYLANTPKDYDLYLASVYLGELKEDNTVNSFSGLTLYTVHSRFYDTFLGINPQEHLDRAMEGKGRFVVCNPFVAEQYDGFSSNTGKEEKYGNLMQGRNLFGR
jgi:hypothetical protein